ncbi:hypothetical protein Sjap_010342 [Stephania japonica]|uniref:Uncharacterized protein n=1 Tax=Stephania japonica TaxID=461633 RepID=A0AAP0JB12_9MAGN
MADQSSRQSFRFRLPWVISAAASQAPPSRAPEPQPSATSVPLLRPPFRPPGAAPPRPFIPRTESMSIPPSRVVSQPSSPTRPFQPPQPAQPSPPPPPSPSPSPARPVIATSPPPPTPENKTLSPQAPQLPSPSKIADQLKAQEIRSPVSLGIPRSQQLTPRSVPAVETKAHQSPPPLSLPPPALFPQPEKVPKSETLTNGVIRPTTTSTTTTLIEPYKPPRIAPTEEPEQRTISELPSTNLDKKTLFGRRVVAGVGDPLIHKDRSPPSPPPKGPNPAPTTMRENKGSIMQLGSPNQLPKRDGPVHIHRGYKLNQEHYSESMTTDGESSSKDTKKPKEQKGKSNKEETKTSKSFVNSNVQGINNSIMFNSSYSERSPGVHLTLSRSVGRGSEGPTTVEARRADFRATEAQKLTYDPTVRRRCLRGLFSEPIESDPDNPGKARRHGCRYNCSEEKKSDGSV